MADSVDMLGDTLVYSLSLYAIDRGPRWRAGAAFAKGLIILAFGIWILFEAGMKLLEGVAPLAPECSRNDVISNVGVLLAAAGVWWTGRSWPDIAIGLIVAALFLRSALSVLRASCPSSCGRGDRNEHSRRRGVISAIARVSSETISVSSVSVTRSIPGGTPSHRHAPTQRVQRFVPGCATQ